MRNQKQPGDELHQSRRAIRREIIRREVSQRGRAGELGAISNQRSNRNQRRKVCQRGSARELGAISNQRSNRNQRREVS
jgi:hypothetical protein